MSNAVLPKFPGLKWDVVRRPVFNTIVRTTVSGREYRYQNYAYPIWRYKLSYELLRARSALPEMQQLAGFFNLHGGSFDTWLYSDPDDYVADGQPFGVGNGTQTEFQLLRSFGGFTEPVYDLASMPVVTLNGSRLSILQNGNNFAGAEWLGSTTVTINTHNDINGNPRADTITDSDAGEASRRYQFVSVVPKAGQAYTFSVYVRKTSGGTSPTFCLVSRFTGGAVPQSTFTRLNTDTGIVIAAGDNDPVVVVSDSGDYWRLSVTVLHPGGGNDQAQFDIYPAYGPHGASASDITTTGSCVCFGARIEVSPTVGAYAVSSYTISSVGVVKVTPAPGAGLLLAWSGEFYWRCRFMADQLEFSQFMRQFWELRTLEFTTVKL